MMQLDEDQVSVKSDELDNQTTNQRAIREMQRRIDEESKDGGGGPPLLRRQTSRYREIGANYRNYIKETRRKNMRRYGLQILIALVLRGLCYLTGSGLKNEYTQRHYSFNTHFLNLMIELGFAWFVSYLTFNNMGIRFRCKCADYFLTAIFVLVRILLAILMIKNLFYDLPVVLGEGWLLCWTNSWPSEGKDRYYTFTSASFVNSFLSWIFFFYVFWATVLLFIFVVAFVYGFCQARQQFSSQLLLTSLSYKIYTGVKYYGLIYLAGTHIDHLFRKREHLGDDDFLNEDDYRAHKQKESDFFIKQKKNFGMLLFNEETDCPICMCEFTADEDVIQLKCSTQHIYHEECLQQYISQIKQKSDSDADMELNCPLCRARIEF